MRFAKFPWLHTLTTRLLIAYIVALVMTAGLVGTITWATSSQYLNVVTGTYRYVHDNEDSSTIRLLFDATGRPVALELPSDSSWIFPAMAADLKYRVVDESGAVVLSSDFAAQGSAHADKPLDPHPAALDPASQDLGMRVIKTVPVVQRNQTYFMQLVASERLIALSRRTFRHILVTDNLQTVLGSLLLFSVVMYYTLRRMLKPLREASSVAARIDPRNLSARIATRNLPVEFSPVIDAFNLALDRLEKGFRVQQEFLADAAHELKTPMALLRAQIETDPAGDRRELLPDLDLMARQVHQLLHLAEVRETRNYVFEPTDVVAVAENVVDFLSRLCTRHEVEISICDLRSSTGMAQLQADRSALYLLLKNVLENAIQHSPPRGVVTVTVDDSEITIRDEGPGIPADDLPKLFTRFWRGPGRRDDGAGLGLAISQEIVRAHGWSLSARSTGHGAEFRLVFHNH
jgi:two-component system, OmpR family, sensor histidine kinase QseC